ncbi:MAG: hypothetical protein GF400_07210 [Candidatus Eisenbacteria bacterium]|nr:hypothetical protein [Candidatus Eisenbacteria bacterium]
MLARKLCARLLAAAVLACLVGVASAAQESSSELEILSDWMTGSFNSSAQADADSSYFDIRLQMARIWPDGYDVWIYVEQAVAGSEGRPYRQRVYRLTEMEGGLFSSDVFELDDPERYVGAWRHDAPLGDLRPKDLAKREGCAVLLRRDPSGDFSGGTVGRCCRSSLGGAAYATSEVLLTESRLESWDRGFDASGRQVWGAEKGPYVFRKTADAP